MGIQEGGGDYSIRCIDGKGPDGKPSICTRQGHLPGGGIRVEGHLPGRGIRVEGHIFMVTW